MNESILSRMALDLGIKRFNDETPFEYESRVAYSAMASWIKAITQDQPISSRETGCCGVSRMHVYERSRSILDIVCKMYPELAAWFELSEETEYPTNLIRRRLLKHGDLLNEGFDTNIALSHPYSIQIASGFETLYGQILSKHMEYAGIATIRQNDIVSPQVETIGAEEWIRRFLHDVWWSSDFPDMSRWQYFNPTCPAKNNYSEWQDDSPLPVYGIILARTVVNKNGYEYYLVKKGTNKMHKIDPFLQQQGYHIQLMYALRYGAQNMSEARIKNYDSHLKLQLNAVLPTRVNLLLESYAWPYNNVSDKLSWTMLPIIWNYISSYIEQLGIKIVEDNDG